jgi:predicted RNase H-like HicB family nuclease
MRLTYPACFYKDNESEAYAVVVPDLPGCVSGGDTLADAVFMGIDAASGWILSELQDEKSIPHPSHINDIQPDPGGFVSLIALDIGAYAEKYGKVLIPETAPIPAWQRVDLQSAPGHRAKNSHRER